MGTILKTAVAMGLAVEATGVERCVPRATELAESIAKQSPVAVSSLGTQSAACPQPIHVVLVIKNNYIGPLLL